MQFPTIMQISCLLSGDIDTLFLVVSTLEAMQGKREGKVGGAGWAGKAGGQGRRQGEQGVGRHGGGGGGGRWEGRAGIASFPGCRPFTAKNKRLVKLIA